MVRSSKRFDTPSKSTEPQNALRLSQLASEFFAQTRKEQEFAANARILGQTAQIDLAICGRAFWRESCRAQESPEHFLESAREFLDSNHLPGEVVLEIVKNRFGCMTYEI